MVAVPLPPLLLPPCPLRLVFPLTASRSLSRFSAQLPTHPMSAPSFARTPAAMAVWQALLPAFSCLRGTTGSTANTASSAVLSFLCCAACRSKPSWELPRPLLGPPPRVHAARPLHPASARKRPIRECAVVSRCRAAHPLRPLRLATPAVVDAPQSAAGVRGWPASSYLQRGRGHPLVCPGPTQLADRPSAASVAISDRNGQHALLSVCALCSVFM
jgi:hypothetical protein